MRGKTQRGGFVALSLCGGEGQEGRRRMDGTLLVKKERSLRQKRSEETLNNAVGDTQGFISISEGSPVKGRDLLCLILRPDLGLRRCCSQPHTVVLAFAPT
jgi:hypothetical protein